MKINVDRMAKLAGLSLQAKNTKSNKKSRYLNESANYQEAETETFDELGEAGVDDLDGDIDEMLEVDEVELVQELRRAKKIMMESKKRKRNQDLQEAELKSIIEEEVQNIFGNMNLNSDWVYGARKPRRSKQGYTHQGSFLKGIGFK